MLLNKEAYRTFSHSFLKKIIIIWIVILSLRYLIFLFKVEESISGIVHFYFVIACAVFWYIYSITTNEIPNIKKQGKLQVHN